MNKKNREKDSVGRFFTKRRRRLKEELFARKALEKACADDEPVWWNWQTLVAANFALSPFRMAQRASALRCGSSSQKIFAAQIFFGSLPF